MRKTFPSSRAPVIPPPGQGRRGEAGHIGYLLRQANNIHRARMERALAAAGLTLPQFSVLTMLRAYPGLSNADLARLSLLTPQTLSVIVANLEKRGAIARRPHQIHGRIQHIDLTAVGHRLLRSCRARVERVEKWLLASTTFAEEKIVKRWLASMAARAS